MRFYRFFLLLLVALTPLAGHSQLFDAGAGNTNGARCVAVDVLGNVYRGGMEGWPGTQYTLEKYFPNGTLDWSVSEGGCYYGSKVRLLTVDGNGNIYAAIQVGDSGVIGGVQQISVTGNQDPYIFKFDNQGNEIWRVPITETCSYDYFFGLEIDNSGNIVFLSQYTSSVTVLGNTLSSAGTHPYWVVLSPSGTFVSMGHNTTSSFASWSATTDGNGNYFYGAFPAVTHSVLKYNSAGVLQWSYAPPGGGGCEFWDIDLDAAGNVYCSGSFDGTFDFGLTSYTSTSMWDDIFVFKLNSYGAPQWVNRYGGMGTDEARYLTVLPNGDVYLGGYFEQTANFDTYSVGSAGAQDVFVAKLNTSGAVQWVNRGGSSQAEFPIDIASNPTTGKVVITANGSNTATVVFSSVVLTGSYGYWISTLEGACQSLGKVFRDLNGSGVQDAGEPGFWNRMVMMNPGSLTGHSGVPGNYGVYSNIGNYTLNLASVPLYYTQTGATSHTANFTALGQIDTANHFALQPTPNMNDLRTWIIPLNYGARSGMGELYAVWYENVGTTDIQNATVSLAFDPALNFNYSYPSYSSFNGTDSLTFDIDTLSIGETGFYFVVLNVPLSLPINTALYFDSWVHPISGDQAPGDNHSSMTHYVVNSYDPNEKRVSPEGDVTPQEVAAGYPLTYTLHFQNTGNDTAFFVRLVDTLSADLDLSTFTWRGESHPSNWSIDMNRVLTIDFYNINLVDSATNEPGSHGYFQYTVSPLTTLQHGDHIDNTCYIYFDFNPAIVTNTTVTNVLDPNSVVKPAEQAAIEVYPVPAHEVVFFRTADGHQFQGTVELLNLHGQQVALQNVNAQAAGISVRELAAGIYVYRITGNGGELIQQGKLVVE